ncbi:MAG: 2-hydroxyglutaryl-CoA dehydratase [Chloroflexi bacterium]|nr:2-hydroxyglutaryl-CoA dehydratase [Chloroflexota bacterium]
MAYAGGVDVGSTQTKAVVVDEHAQIVGRAIIDTGSNVITAAENAFRIAVKNVGVDEAEVEYIVGTGYGRYKVTFGDTQITEISCHARGAVHMFPGTRTVLDMGGQDTKAIRVRDNGEVVDFCMNDKCAAGTGRFLQAAAFALEIPLADLGPTALRAEKAVAISTTCTVFAESEVLSWLGRGKKIEDILLGVHRSIGSRSMALLRRVGIEEQVTFTGGVTKNQGMVEVMNQMLGFQVNTGGEAHLMGALGAALFALDRIKASRVPHHAKEGVA